MPKGVMVHSDRGSQYCSRQFQGLLAKHGLICSMSGKGNCYDSACGESFATREDMRRAVVEYIEIDYNRTSWHRTNGYISPMAFENKMAA